MYFRSKIIYVCFLQLHRQCLNLPNFPFLFAQTRHHGGAWCRTVMWCGTMKYYMFITPRTFHLTRPLYRYKRSRKEKPTRSPIIIQRTRGPTVLLLSSSSTIRQTGDGNWTKNRTALKTKWIRLPHAPPLLRHTGSEYRESLMERGGRWSDFHRFPATTMRGRMGTSVEVCAVKGELVKSTECSTETKANH